MSSLQEDMTITSSNGESVTLPTINFLRLTMIKLQPFIKAYQQETGKSDIPGFNKWISDKFGMTGNSTLL